MGGSRGIVEPLAAVDMLWLTLFDLANVYIRRNSIRMTDIDGHVVDPYDLSQLHLSQLGFTGPPIGR